MASVDRWVARLRARVRKAAVGRDDRRGVTADPVHRPPAGVEPGPARGSGDGPGDNPSGRHGGGCGDEPADEPGTRPVPAVATALGLPPGIVLLTAWAGCLLVVGWLALQVLRLLAAFSEVTVPLAISMLTTALAAPLVDLLERVGVRRRIGALVVVVGGLVALVLLLTLIGRQVASQFDELSRDVAEGVRRVQDWLQDGPLGLSDDQLGGFLDRLRDQLNSADAEVLQQTAAVGTTVGHVVAGFFIMVFATYFFCAQGATIWRWLVGLLPGAARAGVSSSGRVAWASLTAFVRATMLVALTDALGVGLTALLLGVPLALPLGVLVFLGAFVPIIGAAVSGIAAVLVALVAQGPAVAGLMLLAVVVVQQLESHVLQPFLMGRFVAVHPLGIILAIAVGLVAGGVVGALIAVPLVASGHAVGKHLRGVDPATAPATAPAAAAAAAAPPAVRR